MKVTRSRKGRSNKARVESMKREVREDLADETAANEAEAMVRKQLAAAVGHEIPFFGEPPAVPNQAGKHKKKKK